ncbi:MAG: ABC transporter ATP-binding protein [Nitrososphaerales archaeon]
MHSLELSNVDSGYNQNAILHNINFVAKESSIYVVLGPNGAGKTTLFRTIAGILEPFAGKVTLDGESITSSKEVRKRINYLSHFNAIPEEMTVYNALKFYSNIEGGNVDEVISLLNLESLASTKFSDLSQGQKKRVSIAKVFLRERDLYLLDEPTASLDPAAAKEVRDLVLRLSRDKLVLYSSHNLYEASDIGTNLILLKSGTIAYFDKIQNIKSKEYLVGFKTDTDISRIIDAKLGEGGYYVLSVSTPQEAGMALKKLIENGVLVTEMRELGNPLQELFEKPA